MTILSYSIFLPQIWPDGKRDHAVVGDAADEPEPSVVADAVPLLVGLPVRAQGLGAPHVPVEVPDISERKM